MRKIISLILALTVICSAVPAMAAAPSWTMPTGYYQSTPVQFTPVDNAHCYQNSPCFGWPIIHGATYELVVARDEALTDIVESVENIPVNVYTFPHTLEAGKVLYWAVRYKLNNKASEWSESRRFLIDEYGCMEK